MAQGQANINKITGWLAIAFSLLFVYGFLFWEGLMNFKEIEHIFYEVSVVLFAMLLFFETKLIRFALLTLLLIINLTGDFMVVVPEMNIGITVAAWVTIIFFVYKILIQWKKQYRQSSVGESGLV